MILKQIAQVGFNIGKIAIPRLLNALGVPPGLATKTAAGHSSLLTGILLGAGGAFILTSLAIGVISGGTLLAPAVFSAILLNGTLGVLAGTIGWGLFRAGEHELGFPITGKLNQLVSGFKRFFQPSPPPPPHGNSISYASNLSAASESKTSALFRMTKRLTHSFSKATAPTGKIASAPQYKPAFAGPAI